MRRLLFLVAVLTPAAACFAQTETQPQPSSDTDRSRPNSVLVFAGRMSTTDFTSSLLYNKTYTPDYAFGKQAFDNAIAGVDYERDILGLARDLRLRGEVGIDDRFGHFLVCCLIPKPYDPPYRDKTVRTNGLVHSIELWIGGKVRWENFKLPGGIRLEVAGTVGFSGVTRPIGREHQREIEYHANAHFLGFVAPELGLSLASVPRFELVFRVMHRSGAGGTFGGMKEGYNGDVIGVRYAF